MADIQEIVELINGNIILYTSHLEMLRNLAGSIEDSTKILKKTGLAIDFRDIEEFQNEFRFRSLVTISLLDLSVICKNLLKAENDWDRLFFFKHAYLVIYETTNKFDFYIKFLTDIVDREYPDLKEQLNTIINELRDFKKNNSHSNKIKNIRNTVAGHIHIDFVKYYDTLKLIRGDGDTILIMSFLGILIKMEVFCSSLMHLSSAKAKSKIDTSISREDKKKFIHEQLEKLRNKYSDSP